MIDVVTVGWLTVDDIVLTDGTYRKQILGGGALYSAVGAQVFADRVAIHSVCGAPYHDRAIAEIGRRGLDPSGIARIDGNGLELWLLHESTIHKQQLPKLSSSSADEMDLVRGSVGERYRSARGFHIAPQSPAGSLANVRDLARLPHRPALTMDILSDVFIDAKIYENLDFLDHLTAFLPSESEIFRIWRTSDLEAWLRANAQAHDCHMVAKVGERGSIACEARTGRMIRVPALPVGVVDTTGAGDAYCGGFVAGLVAGRPLQECAAMGTVAASFVVEACGALETATPSPDELESRMASVLAGTLIEHG